MLRTRIVTAACLIAFFFIMLFNFSPAQFCVAIACMTLIGAWEWCHFMLIKNLLFKLIYVLIVSAIIFLTLFIAIPVVLMIAALWWLIALGFMLTYPQSSTFWGKGVVIRAIMGILTLIPSWAALTEMRSYPDGVSAILFLLILVSGADTTAYFVGRRFGKHQLAPQLSPNKTIEGALGALLFAILLTILVLIINHTSVSNWIWVILLSIVTVIFSIVGDLFESMLKRQVNLKDSSQLLPGHGGLLDRIDSMMSAAPIFAFGALLFRMYL